MKLVMISDTHNFHNKMIVPSGDVIIHAGDATGMGKEWEIRAFIEWYSKLDFDYKIFVPGNHEVVLEYNYEEWSQWFTDAGIDILNENLLTVNGMSQYDWKEYEYKIYGSPITPQFGNWSYMKARGAEIKKHWDRIPDCTDILVTHGPPHMILDGVPRFNGYVDFCGCEELANRVLHLEPKIHVFGHIHEGAGTIKEGNTEYINASQVDGNYSLVHSPIVRNL